MNRSYKILLVAIMFLALFTAPAKLRAQEANPINAQIVKSNDFYRFSFKSKEPPAFDIMIDGSDIIMDFEKANDLNLGKYIYNKSIIKSFGASADGKSFIIKINAPKAKLRKFITDDNTTGFDLFPSNEQSIRKQIMMSSLPDDKPLEINGPALEAAIAKSAEEEVTPAPESVRGKIVTFPSDFIGPPAASQLYRTKKNFVGPPAYDPTEVAVYEIVKANAKGSVNPYISMDEDGFTLSFPLSDIDSVSAAAIEKGDKILIAFNSISNIDLTDIIDNPFISGIRLVPRPDIKLIEITLNNKKVKKDLYLKAFYKDKVSWTLEVSKDSGDKKFEVTPVNVVAENNFGQKRIVATANDIVGPMIITDPETGEELKTFLIKDNASGIPGTREFVDLLLRKSLQGIFIDAKSDFLQYEVSKNSLIITKLSNLQISDELLTTPSDTNKNILTNAIKEKDVFPSESIFPFAPQAKVVKANDKVPAADAAEGTEGEKAEEGTEHKKEEKKEPKKTEKKAKHSWLKLLDVFGNDAFAQDKEKAETPEESAKVQEHRAGGSAIDFDEGDDANVMNGFVVDDEPETTTKNKDITNTALEFTNNIINASPSKKPDIKFDMAKWYFSKGLYVESLGVLQNLKTESPNYHDIFNVNAMIASAQYLTGKYGEALDGFTSLLSATDKDVNYSEIKLWQWASKYMYGLKSRNEGEVPVDIDFISSFDKFMQNYPLELRYSMALMFLDENIKNGKIEEAKSLLDIISDGGIPKKYLNDSKFIQAYIADKEVKKDLAKSIYNELQKDLSDRKNRARSLVELTKNDLMDNKITSDQAIQKFLQATTIWRDDYFEMDVLEIVGHLYVDQRNYVKALETWKEIANDFPETTESVFILGKMKQLFTELFDTNLAYQLKPLETLKLYFGFRELTPSGEIGDRITRKVAQFFIGADMMEEAIKIIEHQIKYRSSGDDKAKLALWLYDISLDNRDMDAAERALNNIKPEEASPFYMAQKNYALASIVALRGDYNKALDMIKNDFTPDADKVRTELFWQKENWFGVIRTIESRISQIRDTAPQPFTRKEMNDINRLTVAYAAQGDNRKLAALRNEFSKRIPTNADQLLFDYLTNGSKAVDYNNFDNSVELDNISSFINDYSFMPEENWASVMSILEPKVAGLVGRPMEELSRDDKMDVIKLGIAYSMTEPKDEKDANELKKKFAGLARDFKDIRADRFTIDAFSIFDSKVMPKENDAVFEGKIRLADIGKFIPYYKRATKFSELNISIRGQFGN